MDLAHELQLEVIRREVAAMDSVPHLRAMVMELIKMLDRQKKVFELMARREFGGG